MNGCMADRIQTFGEFWPYYLREHARPATRWSHFVGTNLALALGITAAVTQSAWLVPLALVSGYAFAWVSHFAIEKNRPATFKYPLWSLVSDFRMMGFMWVGKLGPELAKAGVPAVAQNRAESPING